jgi:hypothetical protein
LFGPTPHVYATTFLGIGCVNHLMEKGPRHRAFIAHRRYGAVHLLLPGRPFREFDVIGPQWKLEMFLDAFEDTIPQT